MNRENSKRTKHKNPKFRESYDEDFDREDKLEMQRRRKKLGKKSEQRTNIQDKW